MTTSVPVKLPLPFDVEVDVASQCCDNHNARLLAMHACREARYVPHWKRWLIWRDGHWQPDTAGRMVTLAREVARDLYDKARDGDGRDERRAWTRHALASNSARGIRAMLDLASSEPSLIVQPEDLDSDPWLLCTTTGTVDLRTGEQVAHDRKHLITRQVPVPFDPEASSPRWLQFLEEILPDPETRGFLQRAIGYSLTGSTSEQALFFLWGTGANGKSVLLETLLELVSGYGMRTPSETLLLKRSDGIPSDVAAMRGARLVVASETQDGRKLDEARVKQLTGGDTMSACFKYGEWFTFKPVCKLWLATNHKPAIKGGHAIWRRVNLVPFKQRFGNGDLPADPYLIDKLKAELPGVLAWCVLGAVLWHRQGLQAPEAVNAATSEYRAEQDTLAAFLDDVCEQGPDLRVTVAALFKAWRSWCEQNDESAGAKRYFGQRLQEAGFQQTRTKQARVWEGLALTNDGG